MVPRRTDTPKKSYVADEPDDAASFTGERLGTQATSIRRHVAPPSVVRKRLPSASRR